MCSTPIIPVPMTPYLARSVSTTAGPHFHAVKRTLNPWKTAVSASANCFPAATLPSVMTATQMVNFSYAIGDRATGACVLVDPAWHVNDLVDIVEADGMSVEGVLATHYHADHVGGSIMCTTLRASPHYWSESTTDSCSNCHCGWNEPQTSPPINIAHEPGDVLAVET